jgi:hypothetical protein
LIKALFGYLNVSKPVILGTISEFTAAFRNQEDILNIGKFVLSGFRIVKHFLFNEAACTKVFDNGLNFIKFLGSRTTLLRTITGSFCRQTPLPCLIEFISILIEEHSIIIGDSSEPSSFLKRSLLSDVINIFGDFAKTETPPKGADPLLYDVYKLNEIALLTVSSVDSILKSLESEIEQLLEHAGINKTALGNLTIPHRFLASELYSNIYDSNIMMICEDNIMGCDLFDEFEAQRYTESKKLAFARMASGVGKLSLSRATFLPFTFFLFRV